ncbi:YjjW family glycine radical enzyme activase [Peptacetobacter hominis]|uniref:YjjW family glycine radical enzyme activase n=1 Tax=Peptacetobacter hominis TaxID=2743610 RepID=A0A544QWZ3_9FIRM|nr:YjjW family glycine radical enzyme activase [Peptacetobacter hominis]TQQ85226.1 YjjW family glycine radical enzyme activase [Peptacetobacter hominis]
MRAPVNKIIPFSSVDGPGNRTAIFLQGCNQNCLYCHNPETINMCKNCGICVESCPKGALSIINEKVVYDYDKCCNCDTCIQLCPNDASPKVRYMTPEELYDKIKNYLPFIDGITTSGGECSLYADFLKEFYTIIKSENKTTYMDTNAQIPLWDKEELLKVTDKVMIDLKAGTNDDHIKLTGRGVDTVIENIKRIAEMGKLFEIRTVVVPDIVDNMKTIEVGSRLISKYPEVRYKIIKYRKFGVREEYSYIKEPTSDYLQSLKSKAEELGVKNIQLID